jgi:hypothetical protein
MEDAVKATQAIVDRPVNDEAPEQVGANLVREQRIWRAPASVMEAA